MVNKQPEAKLTEESSTTIRDNIAERFDSKVNITVCATVGGKPFWQMTLYVWPNDVINVSADEVLADLKERADVLLKSLEHVAELAMADDWRDLPEIVRIARSAIARVGGAA